MAISQTEDYFENPKTLYLLPLQWNQFNQLKFCRKNCWEKQLFISYLLDESPFSNIFTF